MSGHQLDAGLTTSPLEWPPPHDQAHAAALTVVERVPAEDAALVLSMLGLEDVLR
jgi:hypothetical protein